MKMAKQLIDLKGKKIGKLLVLELDHKKRVNYQNGRSRTTYFWKCECDCGNIVVRSGDSLRQGATVSCGCLKEYKQMMNIEKKKCLKEINAENDKELEL